jgi:hypothetical protein
MTAMNELRRFFAPTPIDTTGTIVERIDTDRYRVSVRSGSIEATASGGAAYKGGDEVLIRAGSILGRVKSIAQVRVYSV